MEKIGQKLNKKQTIMLPENYVIKTETGAQVDEVGTALGKNGKKYKDYFSHWEYCTKENTECGWMIYGIIPERCKDWPIYTYEEWKVLYYKKDFVLPEKWCVKATPCKTVQKFFTTYKNNDIEDFETGDYDNWFFHSDTVDNDWQYTYHRIQDAFTEITFEQFKEYVIGQKMYTIEELNEYKANISIVVHVKNKEEWKKLKQICPNIANYNETKDYYLASTAGYNNTPYYKTIEFEQIEFNKTYTVEECREKNIAVYFKTLEEANMLARESGYTKHWPLQNLNKINCIKFPKNSVCPSWERDNGKYFRNKHNITQFINFEQVKFKQTMENKFGIKVENNAREIVKFLAEQGINHSWEGTADNGCYYYVNNNQKEYCTRNVLSGYKLYTLEEYKQALKGKIIGYKAPYKINSTINADTLYVQHSVAGAFYCPKGKKGHGSEWYLPAQIVETWTPVFEEAIKSKEISLGNPARKFTIFKDKVLVLAGDGNTYTFTPDEIAVIEKKFAKFEWHGVNCNVTSINIGCQAGLAITKETIDTIKEIQSTL